VLSNPEKCCAFRVTAIGVFVFIMPLNEISVVPPMLHVLPLWYACRLSSVCSVDNEVNQITSFKNIIKSKTQIAVRRKAQQLPPNFNAPDSGRVGRNMQCSDEFKKKGLLLNLNIVARWTVNKTANLIPTATRC
jgi:hypothetical protein